METSSKEGEVNAGPPSSSEQEGDKDDSGVPPPIDSKVDDAELQAMMKTNAK